jgi:hypothetical protein
LESLADIQFGVVEINDPDFISSIEGANRAKIQFEDVSIFKKIRINHFLLLEVEVATMVEKMVVSEVLMLLALSLLVVLNALHSLLIIHSPFFLVWEDVVCETDLLELLFGGLWVLWVLIRVVLNCKLFEGLVNFLFCGGSFETHDIVVLVVWFVLLLLAEELGNRGINVDPDQRKDEEQVV